MTSFNFETEVTRVISRGPSVMATSFDSNSTGLIIKFLAVAGTERLNSPLLFVDVPSFVPLTTTDAFDIPSPFSPTTYTHPPLESL